MESRPTPEARRRLEALLEKLQTADTERLRTLRALTALEQMDAPEARGFLEVLARGVPEALLTQEAKAALGRLTRAKAAGP